MSSLEQRLRMSQQQWRDYVVGDRMAVDRQFSDRVTQSDFSSQEWGLIMTATEFRIDDADDPELATVVADTSKVEQIAPQLDEIKSEMGAMGPGGGGGGSSGGSGGIFGSVKDALGIGGDDGRDPEEVRSKAETLTAEYARLLQERLENEGKWDEVRTMAAAEADAGEE
jgi:hypothetical protein